MSFYKQRTNLACSLVQKSLFGATVTQRTSNDQASEMAHRPQCICLAFHTGHVVCCVPCSGHGRCVVTCNQAPIDCFYTQRTAHPVRNLPVTHLEFSVKPAANDTHPSATLRAPRSQHTKMGLTCVYGCIHTEVYVHHHDRGRVPTPNMRWHMVRDALAHAVWLRGDAMRMLGETTH